MLPNEYLAVGQELEFIARVNVLPEVESLRSYLVVLHLDATHGVALIPRVRIREETVHLQRLRDGNGPDLQIQLFEIYHALFSIFQLLHAFHLQHLKITVVRHVDLEVDPGQVHD